MLEAFFCAGSPSFTPRAKKSEASSGFPVQKKRSILWLPPFEGGREGDLKREEGDLKREEEDLKREEGDLKREEEDLKREEGDKGGKGG